LAILITRHSTSTRTCEVNRGEAERTKDSLGQNQRYSLQMRETTQAHGLHASATPSVHRPPSTVDNHGTTASFVDVHHRIRRLPRIQFKVRPPPCADSHADPDVIPPEGGETQRRVFKQPCGVGMGRLPYRSDYGLQVAGCDLAVGGMIRDDQHENRNHRICILQ
jgi:hypothetical protein